MNCKWEKNKNIAVIITFSLMVIGFFILSIGITDKEISTYERRRLTKFPTLNVETVMNTKFMQGFEKYALDHFPFRDTFRQIKSNTALKLLRKKDNNQIYTFEGGIYRMEYPLKEKEIHSAAKKFNEIYDMYLSDMSCYLSIIPDKSYFASSENGNLYMNYKLLEDILVSETKGFEYIDIFKALTKEDYYKTDTHWRQEKLQKVVDALCAGMGVLPTDFTKYNMNIIKDFKGVYYGQGGIGILEENLNYLTNDAMNEVTVFNHETQEKMLIYDLDNINSLDPYNIFLSGPTTIVDIENPNASSKKELIIFRDSFASSLTPMLIESYSKITLVDIRYIPASLLKDYIAFKDQDVLFLYSTLILNNATALRI